MTKTVVLVHGAWVTTDSWARFRQAFEASGYQVHTPTWPYLEGRTAAELNAAPPPALGSLSIGAIADHLQSQIQALPQKPLLVGHSFGGLLTQILLDRGVGWAGVALNPAPIGGIVPGWLTLTAAVPPIGRLNGWNRPYSLSRARFADRYANGAPRAEQDEAYDTYVIPTPGRIFYQAASWIGTGVDPRRRTQPLLISAGNQDRLVTPYLSRAAYALQRRSPARTDFIDFPGRSHLLIAEPGWEEVAGRAIEWAERL